MTTPRIHQLPDAVVAQIAAGEVIERPASVVKELLENSIDAGATRIDIDLEAGGTELIRVVDNGRGFDPADLPLAFRPHATSKLLTAADLFAIATLGFRGEALASVGGVAQVLLQSRPTGAPLGASVACNGGSLGTVQAWSGAPGTRIEVRHLFYNTPVRKKFLRSIPTEVGHVTETATRLALAYPQLHLVVKHNGRLVAEVPGTASLLDRIGVFFGRDVANALYAVDVAAGPARLRGYVADPSCDRGTPKTQYWFVNGRCIRDRSLGHALQEGYRSLLMTGRFAVAFLFLDVPADAVDVNVHPTKAEVRFRDAQAMYHLVLATVRERLRLANLVPRMMPPQPPPPQTFAPPAPWEATPPELPLPPRPAAPLPEPPAIAAKPAAFAGPPPVVPVTVPGDEPPREAPLAGYDLHKALQVHDAYLVVETPEGMLVIDQHALHERILFEQLRRRLADGQLERQRLLIPEPVDLPAELAARVLECRDALADLGLEVEDFGRGTLLVCSYPALLKRAQPADLLRDVADRVAGKDRPPTRDQLFHDLLATMACRAAVKAGDRLTPEEVQALIAQRELAENTTHCPHGRPTSLLFSRKELDKQFRRI